mgnify:CR=1 FL=1
MILFYFVDANASAFGLECQDSVISAESKLHPNEVSGRTIFPNTDGLWEVYNDDALTVTAAPLEHRITCYGYVILEQDLPGKLDASLLKQKGIPPGPLYAKVKRGENIVAPDGSIISSKEVVGMPRPGRKLVILGDTHNSSRIKRVACNADVIVHEATLEDEMEEKAVEQGHSTPSMYELYLNTKTF